MRNRVERHDRALATLALFKAFPIESEELRLAFEQLDSSRWGIRKGYPAGEISEAVKAAYR